MSPTRLQRWIDELLETSRQQWRLRVVAVLGAVGALLATMGANGQWWPFGLVAVTMLAIGSAFRPDTHMGLVVIGAIVWYWLASVHDLDTPWLPIASVCLLVFHTVIALSATIPTGGELALGTLQRWFRGGVVVAAATVLMWVLIVLLDRRAAAGNGLVTGAAIAIAALGAVAIRSRSVEPQA